MMTWFVVNSSDTGWKSERPVYSPDIVPWNFPKTVTPPKGRKFTGSIWAEIAEN